MEGWEVTFLWLPSRPKKALFNSSFGLVFIFTDRSSSIIFTHLSTILERNHQISSYRIYNRKYLFIFKTYYIYIIIILTATTCTNFWVLLVNNLLRAPEASRQHQQYQCQVPVSVNPLILRLRVVMRHCWQLSLFLFPLSCCLKQLPWLSGFW